MIMTDDKRTHPMRIAVDFIAPWKVECPICGKVVNKDELEEHIRREHERQDVHMESKEGRQDV